MNALEIEALFVRHRGAMEIVGKEPDPWKLLRMVLAPSPEVLAASLQVARETGPSARAIELASRKRGYSDRTTPACGVTD